MKEAEKEICKMYLEDMDKERSCNEYKILMNMLERQPCENRIPVYIMVMMFITMVCMLFSFILGTKVYSDNIPVPHTIGQITCPYCDEIIDIKEINITVGESE